MKDLLILLFSSLFLTATGVAAEPDGLPLPNWSFDSAVSAAGQADTEDALARLYGLVREGRGDLLLQEVIAIDGNTALPGPVRDRILFELATSLGDFEAGAVGPETLEYLRDRPALARVPYEENPSMGIPLYNVRAAAAGSLAAWARQGERSAAESRFTDVETFLEFLSTEPGPGIAGHIREAGKTFDPAELETIVLAAPRLADTATASLVIGELSPGLLQHPAVMDLMFELLGNRALGGSAALALGHSRDQAVLLRLADVAAENTGLAARRASLAIDRFLAEEQRP